jgi:hypothetical protein
MRKLDYMSLIHLLHIWGIVLMSGIMCVMSGVGRGNGSTIMMRRLLRLKIHQLAKDIFTYLERETDLII